MSWFSDGIEWVADAQTESAGVSVTYARPGVGSVTLTAVSGRTAAPSAQPGGPQTWVTLTERDYLIRAADLVIGGSAVTPRAGDRITETLNGSAQTFEVAPAPGEREWRLSDDTTYRVHCKRVS